MLPEKLPALQVEYPALQNMKFFYILLGAMFATGDPDPRIQMYKAAAIFSAATFIHVYFSAL
jgi:hypothetical protein